MKHGTCEDGINIDNSKHRLVAVRDCDDIGKIILIRSEGERAQRRNPGDVLWTRPESSRVERFLVTDCAGIADGGYSWMIESDVLVEVDAKTAERWDTVGYGKRIEILQRRREYIYRQ